MNRSEGILQAEKKNMTLYEFDEKHSDLEMYNNLTEFMLKNSTKIIPTTFTDRDFDDFIYDRFN
jgi:nitrogenase subunit NifH